MDLDNLQFDVTVVISLMLLSFLSPYTVLISGAVKSITDQ